MEWNIEPQQGKRDAEEICRRKHKRNKKKIKQDVITIPRIHSFADQAMLDIVHIPALESVLSFHLLQSHF